MAARLLPLLVLAVSLAWPASCKPLPVLVPVTKDPATLLYTLPFHHGNDLVVDTAGPLVWSTCQPGHLPAEFTCSSDTCRKANAFQVPGCHAPGCGHDARKDRTCTAYPYNPVTGACVAGDLVHTRLVANTTDGVHPVSQVNVRAEQPPQVAAAGRAWPGSRAPTSRCRRRWPPRRRSPTSSSSASPAAAASPATSAWPSSAAARSRSPRSPGGTSRRSWSTRRSSRRRRACRPRTTSRSSPSPWRAPASAPPATPWCARRCHSPCSAPTCTARSWTRSPGPWRSRARGAGPWRARRSPWRPSSGATTRGRWPTRGSGTWCRTLGGGTNWTMNGLSSMVDIKPGTACLAFARMEGVKAGDSAAPAVLVGGFQMENTLLEFDMAKKRLGFVRLPSFTQCGHFNFTKTGY